MKLCNACAERCDRGGLTGQGCRIPSKFTCEGCGSDVTFVVYIPDDNGAKLQIEVALAQELEANQLLK